VHISIYEAKNYEFMFFLKNIHAGYGETIHGEKFKTDKWQYFKHLKNS